MSYSLLKKTTASNFQRCTRCIMDTSAKDITFDKNGICNFCTDFINRTSHIIYEDLGEKALRLEKLLTKIRETHREKQYDCIVGVSGGVDSSWTLVETMRLGLRPLAVHMDNGWNSELAQNNIANLVNKLNVDLYTYVIDWREYRSLMQAFFDADVVDIELLYDNALLAVCYAQAHRFGVKYILSGGNEATEGIDMPREWNWYKRDVRNIRALAKRFGSVKIKSFPTHSTVDFLLDEYLYRINWISFLDYLPYIKSEALNTLENSFGYKRYLYKHYESIFTRFYQGYILPNKFGVDKRLVHLSALIASGQMPRDEALGCINGIPYPSQQDLDEDIKYFLKKMEWRLSDLERYMQRPAINHSTYPSERNIHKMLTTGLSPRIKKIIKRLLFK